MFKATALACQCPLCLFFPPKDVFFAFPKVFKQGSLLCLLLLTEVPFEYIGINLKKRVPGNPMGG